MQILWQSILPDKCLRAHLKIQTNATQTGSLRAHLKTHSGESQKPCNHCDFASSETGNLMFGIICYQLSSIIKTEGSFILFLWGFSSILTHHEDIPNLSEVPKFFLFQSEKWKFETIGNQWSIWLSLKQAFGHTRASASKEQMDNCDFGLKDATLKNMMEMTDNVSKSKNKCNQSDFTSPHAGDLRRHLKTRSGEKSNKCSQCDFASSRADNLKNHLKMHSREKSNKCNQCDYASGRQFEDTFENAQWRKVKQMQSVWLCLFWGRPFEETYEDSQWRKVK